MTSRSRPRGAQLKDDADEERSIWNQLRADAKKVDQLVVSSRFVSSQYLNLPVWASGLALHEADSCSYLEFVAVPHTNPCLPYYRERIELMEFAERVK